jgi:Putative Se/S carrier protein-like
MPASRSVLLFPTTHAVMRAAQLLEDAGIAHETIPRPKGADADCGIAVAVTPSDRDRAVEVLRRSGSEPGRILAWESPAPGAKG